MKEKDTYKYHLMVGKKVVHKDICTDWVRREASHQQEFPGSRIRLIGRKTTREAALKWVRRGGRREYRLNRGSSSFAKWFSPEQKKVGMWVVIFTGALFIGVIVMSILGAEHASFHVISLTEGWTGRLWDALWVGVASGLCFIMGAVFSKLLEITGDDSEGMGDKG